jgi:hypothetical protein
MSYFLNLCCKRQNLQLNIFDFCAKIHTFFFSLPQYVTEKTSSSWILEMYISINITCVLFLSDFNQNLHTLTNLIKKSLNMKFHENPSCGIHAIPRGHVDRRTDLTRLIVVSTFWTRPLHHSFLSPETIRSFDNIFERGTCAVFVWMERRFEVRIACNSHRLPFFSSLTKRREIFAGTQLVRDPSGSFCRSIQLSSNILHVLWHVVFMPAVSVFVCRGLYWGRKERRIYSWISRCCVPSESLNVTFTWNKF